MNRRRGHASRRHFAIGPPASQPAAEPVAHHERVGSRRPRVAASVLEPVEHQVPGLGSRGLSRSAATHPPPAGPNRSQVAPHHRRQPGLQPRGCRRLAHRAAGRRWRLHGRGRAAGRLRGESTGPLTEQGPEILPDVHSRSVEVSSWSFIVACLSGSSCWGKAKAIKNVTLQLPHCPLRDSTGEASDLFAVNVIGMHVVHADTPTARLYNKI